MNLRARLQEICRVSQTSGPRQRLPRHDVRQLGILAGKKGRIFKAYHHGKDNDCSSIPSVLPHPISHLFFKIARSPGKGLSHSRSMVGICNVMDEWLHGNKYNLHYYPHCRYMDTAVQCFNYLLKDIYGWPGNRTGSLNVGPRLFPSYQCFSKWRALHRWDLDGSGSAGQWQQTAWNLVMLSVCGFQLYFSCFKEKASGWGPHTCILLTSFDTDL